MKEDSSMKKIIIYTVLIAILVTALVGCGKSGQTSDTPKQEASTNKSNADEHIEETEQEQPQEDTSFSSYAGTWIGVSDKFTLSMNDENTLFLDYDSFFYSIDEYINISEIVDNKYQIHYSDLDGYDMILEMEFLQDMIVMNHTPVVTNSGYPFSETFERYIHSNATLDINEYFDENSYYQEYSSGDDTITLMYEMETLNILISLDNGTTTVSFGKKMGTSHDKGILLTPDEKNGKSISFNVEKRSDGNYSNNPLGTDGTITLTFDNGVISYKLTNCSFETNAFEGLMTKCDSQDDIYTPEQDSYYVDNNANSARPDDFYTYPTEQYYDLNTESGYLAYSGLTEAQFKNLCTPISSWGLGYNRYPKSEQCAINVGANYYAEHPDDAELNKWIGYWYDGDLSSYYQENYNNIEEFLADKCYYNKGEELIYENTNTLFEKMREYPNDYIGTPVVFIDFYVDGLVDYTYFSDDYDGVRLYDMRDNVQNPNVLTHNTYFMYAIFTGTYQYYDGVGLNFSLISLEKLTK